MAQLMHIRIEDELKSQIEQVVKQGSYGSITEFTKDAIRKNLREYQKLKLDECLEAQREQVQKHK